MNSIHLRLLVLSPLHRFPQVQFEYQDPRPNFERSKVKGPVAKLIRVKDMSTATALEVTAGSKVALATVPVQCLA